MWSEASPINRTGGRFLSKTTSSGICHIILNVAANWLSLGRQHKWSINTTLGSESLSWHVSLFSWQFIDNISNQLIWKISVSSARWWSSDPRPFQMSQTQQWPPTVANTVGDTRWRHSSDYDRLNGKMCLTSDSESEPGWERWVVVLGFTGGGYVEGWPLTDTHHRQEGEKVVLLVVNDIPWVSLLPLFWVAEPHGAGSEVTHATASRPRAAPERKRRRRLRYRTVNLTIWLNSF